MNSNQIGDTTNLILTKKRPSQIDLDTHKQVEKKYLLSLKSQEKVRLYYFPTKMIKNKTKKRKNTAKVTFYNRIYRIVRKYWSKFNSNHKI